MSEEGFLYNAKNFASMIYVGNILKNQWEM